MSVVASPSAVAATSDAESTVAMFLLAFRLALSASTNLADFDPDDASGSTVAGVETAVNLAEGFSGAKLRTCGCGCARSLLLPLLLATFAGVLTAAVSVAASFVTLFEDWRTYQPPAPINNRTPAAMAPIKNFLLDFSDAGGSPDRASCLSARKCVRKDEAATSRLALLSVSVILPADRSSPRRISPKQSGAS